MLNKKNKNISSSYGKIIQIFEKKIKKIKKKYLKFCKIKSVGLDSIRSYANYNNIIKLINDDNTKLVAKYDEYTKYIYKGTGIYFKIYNDKRVEFYNICQYYENINYKNQEKLFKLILKKIKIYEVDICFDSKKDIFPKLQKKNNYKSSIYYENKNFSKIVKYNKQRKNNLKDNIYRIEFTLKTSLNKNKKNTKNTKKNKHFRAFVINADTNKVFKINLKSNKVFKINLKYLKRILKRIE